MAPRWPQDGPRWSQDGPRTCEDGSKTPPNCPQTQKDSRRVAQCGPKMAHDGPKAVPGQAKTELKGFWTAPPRILRLSAALPVPCPDRFLPGAVSIGKNNTFLHIGQLGPKTTPRRPQWAPIGSQRGPKTGPKRAPMGPQESPCRPRDGSGAGVVFG